MLIILALLQLFFSFSVPYKLLRAVANLSDAWVENGDESGKTWQNIIYKIYSFMKFFADLMIFDLKK